MTRLIMLILGVAGLVAAPLTTAAAQQPARRYQVIVNPANPVGMITTAELSQLFLRKNQAWRHNGAQILPVELGEGHSVREAFVREIHHKDEASLKSYWRQMIFSGKAVPPQQESSDEDVLNYVRRYANAIGYVSASATLPADVKLVTVTP